ncbi:MAG TPA: hypothetical protein VFQ61_37830 [Polyangiaceae bacterium]|nr:hypothetical protein [Polyangiaceae bacterium]
MHDQNLAILKGLVCVAWADGAMHATERQLLEALLQAFNAKPSEALEIRLFAEQPRTLQDVPIHDLSYADRRMLLTQAVILSFADGEQHSTEQVIIKDLARELRIPDIEARGIIAAAEEQARQSLELLAK